MLFRSLLLAALLALPGLGRSEVEIAYQVTVSDPVSKLFHVRCEVSGLTGKSVDLALPAYAIGNHQRRAYSHYVTAFREAAGHAVVRNGAFWRVPVCQGRAAAQYDVRAFETEASRGFVQAFLSPEGGYFLGPALLMYPRGHTQSRCRLKLELPEGWKVGTALEPADDSGRAFTAPDYRALLDCPVELGRFREQEVTARGHQIRFVLSGKSGPGDRALLTPAKRIAEAELDLFGWAPFDRYTYITHFGRFLGGLEHRRCCTMNLSASDGGLRIPTLIMAHELFHAWNGKAVRPQGWGADRDLQKLPDGDYLWIYEGLTAYYTDVILARSGLRSAQRFREEAAEQLEIALNNLRGTRPLTVSELSSDSLRSSLQLNRNIFALYARGFMVGLLFDLRIRHDTKNRRSLDDVMRLMVERYGKTGQCYGPDAFRRALDEATGLKLSELYQKLIHSVEDPPLEEYLAWGDLELQRSQQAEAVLGVYTARPDSTRVVAVVPHSAAAQAGLSAGDVIVKIGGREVSARAEIQNGFAQQLTSGNDGIAVVVRREGHLLTLRVRPRRRVVCRITARTPNAPAAIIRPRPRLEVRALRLAPAVCF